MKEAIEILKKELYSVEYLYKNYERANVLKHIDIDGMQKKIDGLKYSISILENRLS
jgi:hypothetical protein